MKNLVEERKVKHAILLLIPLALLGCEKLEYSDVLTEKGTVSETIYTPSSHGTGMGWSFGGKNGPKPVVTSISVPSKYAIVFECAHGKFVVENEGDGSKAHGLWKRLKKGQEVTIKYREVYVVTETERHLKDYDFVDAE